MIIKNKMEFRQLVNLAIIMIFGILVIENSVSAQDIKKLERQLEYLKEKQVLDIQLKRVKEKLKLLKENYSDVVSSTVVSGAPVVSNKPVPKPKKESTLVPKNKGDNHVWKVKNPSGSCVDNNGLEFVSLKIWDNGKFIAVAEARGGWSGDYSGNLRNQKIELDGGREAHFAKYKIKADPNGYNITAVQEWDTGECDITFRVE